MKKIIQNLLPIILFILTYSLCSGQNNNMEDVVYLKNGSIIRGLIIEQVPNQSIKIQTKDRNVFVFKYDEIEKITKENAINNNSNNSGNDTQTTGEFKKKGFINLTEINYCPGVGDVKFENLSAKNEDYSFGFKTVLGYQFNEHLSLGLGVGIDKYKNIELLPLTLDTRVSILKGKVSPVFIGDIGYSFGLNGVEGGLVINPQVGIRTYISKNTAYIFNIGYKWQKQKVTYRYPSSIYGINYYAYSTEEVFFKFITISTGFSF
jgi:sRNA-binding regulator protein Hfq